MRRSLLFVLSFCCASPSLAQFPVRLETAADCDPELGRVSVGLDRYGATGTSTRGGVASFDPADDAPNRGLVSTVYDSMGFLCRTRADGHTEGTWFDEGFFEGGDANAMVMGGAVNSAFAAHGIDVSARFSLDCTTLNHCYRFTNRTGQVVETLALYQYVDGDLFFEGAFSNDFGATGMGEPRTLWEFDEGDDPQEPTTFLGIYGDDAANARLHSWEIGQFAEHLNELERTGDGCVPLRNTINRRGDPSDDNGDLVTDDGWVRAMIVFVAEPEVNYSVPVPDEDDVIHVDTGDYVIVINAEKIALTGDKWDKKLYQRHTGYIGGLKEMTYRRLIERRPTLPVREAVRRMLPKSKLGRRMLRKLKIYEGPAHPHSAQQPVDLEL